MTPTASRTSQTTATSTPIAQGITDGLLAWYPLNGIRTTGSTLPVQANTIMGAAQYFDGVNDYHQTTLDLANKSFTVAFWAAFANDDFSSNPSAISGGSNSSQYQSLNIMYWGNDFVCSFYFDDLAYTPPLSFDRKQWHHYACSYDITSSTRSISIDGVVVASDRPGRALQTTNIFTMGKPPWNYSYFKGTLRDVMVYNRALSASEINRIKDITPNSVMLSEPHPASACRWVDKGGMVHEYEINQDLLTWDQAKAAAESRTRGGQQGYLATITSQAENECVWQLINAQLGWTSGATGYGPWIGGKRVSSGGVFIWQGGPEKGMQLKSSTIDAPIGYENWTAPMPDNAGNAEPYMHYFGTYSDNGTTWNDNSEHSTKSIIEYTYPESHTISGVAYTDTNNNNQLDAGDFRAANQAITLTADLAQPIDIVGGGNQMCARLDDGRAVCWGRRGDTWRWDQQSAVPIEVDGWRDVRAISNGFLTSCALLGNGTVSCLGKNSNGAVGDGSTTDRWTPVAVSGLTNVVALSSGGGYHHCAVLATGAVKCWGMNSAGQLGDGTYTRRTIPTTVTGLSGVTQVSVGERHTCARKQDGTVWCWGSNDAGQLASTLLIESTSPVQIAGLTGIKDIKSGAQHMCVIRSDNSVACWGYPAAINGERSTSFITTPTSIAGATSAQALAVGREQSCILKADGTVWCWGHVFRGEVGWVASGTTTTRRTSATQMSGVSGAVQLTLASDTACVRLSNTGMQCWGSGEYGQLGSGAYLARGISSDVRVTWQTNPYAARAAALYAGVNYRCAILTDRRVACWGAQGANYKLANAPTLTEAGILDGITDAVDIYLNGAYACVLQRQGTTWCWGHRDGRDASIMPPGMTVNTPIPQRMPSVSDGVALAGGNGGALCVIQSNQSAQCFVADYWNEGFQMRPTSGVSSDVGQVGAGYLHVCMVKHTQSAVWCWGHNNGHQLADTIALNTSTSTPQQIPGLTIIQQMAVGWGANCVLLHTGQVQCWGAGWELYGGGGSIATPTTISQATTMKRISVGTLSCGVKADGTVWCWGSPVPGETSAATSLTARQLLGITDAIDVSATGSTHTNGSICVLRRSGEVRCMGSRVVLGDGSQTDRGVLRAISEPWQANPNRGCDWVDSQGQRHVYESLSGNWTWTQARDMAAARTWRDNNGYLATIMSPEENRCVHQLFMKLTTTEQWPGLTNGWYPRRWLGGSDAESEGTWKWMTGPEQGVQFRENVAGFDYIQSGYSQFQTLSDACKPDCASQPNWDYLQLMFPYGTFVQRSSWNDYVASDNQVGALVEYSTGAGETARTYTTTTDSQGSYAFDGLAPGVYTVQSTTHGTSSTQRVVIWPDQRDERVDFVNRSVTTSLRQTMTAQPTMTRTATRTISPTQTRTPVVKNITAGGSNTVVLKHDGTIAVFGSNTYGQLNVPAGLNDVASVAVSTHNIVALRKNGTVIVWGDNSYGQNNVPAGLSGVIAVAAGGMHVVALKNNGTVIAWGFNGEGAATVPAGLSNVVAISTLAYHTVALKSDGTVVVWGNNSAGQTNVPAGLSNVIAIGAGAYFTMALKSDGTVAAWGDNVGGQTNVPTGLTNVVAIAAGGWHAVALKNDGTVVAWGRNQHGQATVPSGLTNVRAISSAHYHVGVLKNDGMIVGWGWNGEGQLDIPVFSANAPQFTTRRTTMYTPTRMRNGVYP
jgi:alpha-tubulin suppressor-like RCC1 family protein